MNCSKCNSELKDGAKFCTSCGSQVATSNQSDNPTSCKKCSAPLKLNAKFCTKCGEKIANNPVEQGASGEGKEMSVVKQRIFWNVKQGEIARRINEAEFTQYDSALGIIINDGTTAYIRSEGKQIAEIKGGAYNFVESKELDKILQSRVGGVAGGFKTGFKFLMNLVLGQKVKDRIESENIDRQQQNSLDSIVECMKRDTLLSLTLKLDKDFELIFGAAQRNIDNYANFLPMAIKTKYIDINVGVRAIFKITDFQKFSQYYLSDNNIVSTSLLADKLTPIIKAAVQEVMYDVENIDSRLPQAVLDNIRNKIASSSNEFMYGITLEKIVEITSESEDIERFRALSRELYLSEKELDYLNRTNDFKNRLSTVIADQSIYEGQSELELKKRLDNINKDRLLHEDELEKFVMALHVDKLIREAHSQEEVNSALLEVEKRGLLRTEDYNSLADSVRKGDYDRNLSFDLMQIKGDGERNRAQIETEKVELERIRQQRMAMADIEMQEQKIKDDYTISKQSRARSAEMDLDERAAESSFDRLRRIKEMEQAEEDARHRREKEKLEIDKKHEMDMQEARLREIATKGNFTAEQLMAMAANENLSPEAAAKFAESFSAGKDAAVVEKYAQARLEDKDREADRLERMMDRMMSTAETMSGHIVQGKDQQKNEYKERLQRQEDRLDKTQDKALDYTTKNNLAGVTAPPPPPAATQQVVYFISMPNGEVAPHSLQQVQQLIQQGVVGAGTYIYPSNGSDWVLASALREIAHHFIPAQGSKSVTVCASCGSNIAPGSKFCDICGKSIL